MERRLEKNGYRSFFRPSGRWGISSSGTPWVAGQEGGHKPGTKYGGYWAVKNILLLDVIVDSLF
jgi:hypothetical protein